VTAFNAVSNGLATSGIERARWRAAPIIARRVGWEMAVITVAQCCMSSFTPQV